MKASDATSNDKIVKSAKLMGATFAKVLDGRKQPIRGLWIRGTRYYARLNVENPLTGIKKTSVCLWPPKRANRCKPWHRLWPS